MANLPAGTQDWQTHYFEGFLFMFFVYSIKSIVRNYIYVGLTNNLERRLQEHNNGRNRTTKAYCPFILIYQEMFETRPEARKKEKYLKSGIGKVFLKSIR